MYFWTLLQWRKFGFPLCNWNVSCNYMYICFAKLVILLLWALQVSWASDDKFILPQMNNLDLRLSQVEQGQTKQGWNVGEDGWMCVYFYQFLKRDLTQWKQRSTQIQPDQMYHVFKSTMATIMIVAFQKYQKSLDTWPTQLQSRLDFAVHQSWTV